MPSLIARLTKLYRGYKFSAIRYAKPEQAVENVLANAAEQDTVDPVPADIAGNDQFTLVEKKEKLPAGQEWVVHHLSLSEGYQGEKGVKGKEQVIVYWHGGAFIRKATPHHWQFVKTIMLATGLPVVVPHYTKSPLATSSQSVLGAISLLLSISRDPAYKDKEIVLMGDSAGGWFVLRLILAMTELALGEFKGAGGDLFDKEECKVVRSKMKKGVAISGCFELDLARTTFKEDELLQPDDPWLSQVALRPTIPLWTYGPHAVTPSASSRLPADCPALTHPEYIPSENQAKIDDPMFAPTTGVDVLRRYAEKEQPEKPVRIIMSVGTADILYNQNTRMYEALKGLGEGVVQPTLITEEGLFHVYPLIQYLFESKEAIKQFVGLINDE